MSFTFEQKVAILKYAAEKVTEEEKQESPALGNSIIHDLAKQDVAPKIVSFDKKKQDSVASIPSKLVEKK